MPKPVLPTELFDEIINYLWNDSKSLSTCSLANKVMIVPCQRRLFHRIALVSPGQQRSHYTYTSDGTSFKFFKLLMESPHIAGYVRSLFIYDGHDLLDAAMVYTQSKEGFCRRRWLAQDKYLPDFAPLLCNLQALTISYFGKWKHLSFKVFSGLMHIMQLTSLLYIRLEHRYPDCILDLAIGENVKHLSVDGNSDDDRQTLPVHQLSHLPSGPVCIESLSTSSSLFLKSLLALTPTRFNTRGLRRVVVNQIHDGPIRQAFLENCDALEDLKVVLGRGTHYPIIDLGKLATMTRFTASLGFVHENYDGTLKNLPWLYQVLLSGSTSNQALREIAIEVDCYYDQDYYSIVEWKEIFSSLDRYSNLKVLNITMRNPPGQIASKQLFDWLNTCNDVERLRNEKNVEMRVFQEYRPDPDLALNGHPGETGYDELPANCF